MKRKYTIRIISLVFIIVLIDFSPVIYYKIFPGKGSWPNFYNYDHTTYKELIKSLEKIKSDELTITYYPDTRKYPSHFTQVVFLDKVNADYYHTWVLVDTIDFKNRTQIVFGYISKSIDYKAGKAINVDYDLITNYFRRRQFEKHVIDKLNVN